ncbi:hypothetical protein CFOL_v3_13437, partial [Cephalotus follicularis]
NEVEFHRVFWTFSPSIERFKYCHPVISIDATHLYGKYNFTMMIAMIIDVNEEGYPWKEPSAFHRYYLRHFLSNFQNKFHDSHLKALAYKAVSHN